MGNNHILILGGARSGKTALAEKTCLKLSSNPAYIATAEAGDGEMAARIALHKNQRSKNFTTFEEALNLAKAIQLAKKNHDVILIDCLTLWLSNLTFSTNVNKDEQIRQLQSVLTSNIDCTIVMVSNEVGMGIVPDNRLARQFGDEAGLLHQNLAQICANVCLSVAGLPMMLKGQLPEV
ncbi:MAG: bifunctional adenosylcobinamide kinase/adenosylcobinamide-phosphate guanylyltransferase [Devosiaceae bacterium]|nr:bifunctional adenosylcobinamide kinase/adenosylcobinamide-phosphate guanylyltransferase [Devosiaceae bacterium]